MKYAYRWSGSLVALSAAILLASSLFANAEVQSGQVFIQAVKGDATYSDGGAWLPLKERSVLNRGTTIKTGRDSTVDFMLQYNGSALRLTPDSSLRFEKLDKEGAGEAYVTETSLNLISGSLVGSQRKLANPSKFEISLPSGMATIKGTEYLIRADGAVTCVSGSVTVIYNKSHNGGSVQVTVNAGFSFNPATGKVVPTTSGYLQNIISDINTVRQNAQAFKAGGATIVVKPEEALSPTRGHGNNGVGNGIDPQPPGNPPINDGPGTSPGNPGNKGGAGGKDNNGNNGNANGKPL